MWLAAVSSHIYAKDNNVSELANRAREVSWWWNFPLILRDSLSSLLIITRSYQQICWCDTTFNVHKIPYETSTDLLGRQLPYLTSAGARGVIMFWKSLSFYFGGTLIKNSSLSGQIGPLHRSFNYLFFSPSWQTSSSPTFAAAASIDLHDGCCCCWSQRAEAATNDNGSSIGAHDGTRNSIASRTTT